MSPCQPPAPSYNTWSNYQFYLFTFLPNPQLTYLSVLLPVLWQKATALFTGQALCRFSFSSRDAKTPGWSGVIARSLFPQRMHGQGQHSLTLEADKREVSHRLWVGEAKGFFPCLLFSPWAFSGQAGTDEGREVTFRHSEYHFLLRRHSRSSYLGITARQRMSDTCIFPGERYSESPFDAVAESDVVVGTGENISRQIKVSITWEGFGKQKVLPWWFSSEPQNPDFFDDHMSDATLGILNCNTILANFIFRETMWKPFSTF